MEQKNFVGSGTKVEFKDGGELFNLYLCLDDMIALPKSVHKDGKAHVRLTMSARRETGKFGETHTVYENTFKPKLKEDDASKNTIDPEDLPF